ncbi:MAG: CatB-related O-acetyltransferase [Acetobacter sp.]
MAQEVPRSEFVSTGRSCLYNGDISIVASKYAKVSFGSFCAIGKNLKIMTLNHDWNYPAIQGTFYKNFFDSQHPGEVGRPTKERTKGDVAIGNDVWIGDDVKIMSGVSIGDGCCIGAGSVVTSSIAPYTIAAGIPCKVLRHRFSSDVIELLLSLRWWEWSDERIQRNINFFHANLSLLNKKEILNLIV